jgi:hypothetical protein
MTGTDLPPDQEILGRILPALTMAVQLLEVREQQLGRRAAAAAAQTRDQIAHDRSEEVSQRAVAHTVTGPARSTPRWYAQASMEDLARVWCQAAKFADADGRLERVADAVEAEWRRRAPGAMADYDAARAGGATRPDAMRPLIQRLGAEAASSRPTATGPTATGPTANAGAAPAATRRPSSPMPGQAQPAGSPRAAPSAAGTDPGDLHTGPAPRRSAYAARAAAARTVPVWTTGRGGRGRPVTVHDPQTHTTAPDRRRSPRPAR